MVPHFHELRAPAVSSAGPLLIKPDREGLTRAAQLLREGGVVAFPTDTVYGLGADASDDVAQRRIYRIKGRPVGMPLILMAAAESQLEGWVHVDSRAEAIIRRWWPGSLTVIIHAFGGGTLGVRIPNHEVALELLRASGPLLTTSANLHGKDPAMTAEEAGELPGLAAVLDGGRAPGGTASTVLDLTGPEPHILREGAIPTDQLLGPPPPRAG
jgi:L-threonylcarbamoyladenylate synthase